MVVLGIGVRHRGPEGAGHPGRADPWLNVLGPRSSAVEEAASPPGVHLWPELPLQLHPAPDPGAVSTDIGLDVGGPPLGWWPSRRRQLRAPLQRRRDRPAQVRVVPSPHRDSLSN
jgi:hypothetical protein